MRNLPSSITKQDLEQVCKSYDGFKRVALSEPAAERAFQRRAWITFDSNVDVKKICWQLQNIKIKDCNPGAIVNRELTSRIRPIAGPLATHHKQTVKNDLKLAMKIIQNMDKRWNLWQESSSTTTSEEQEDDSTIKTETDEQKKDDSMNTSDQQQSTLTAQQQADNDLIKLEEQAFAALSPTGPQFITHRFNGQNPLLENITDYLVDEVNAEEEELLNVNEDNEVESSPTKNKSSASSSGPLPLDIDKKLNQILDKMLLYLRIVHSIDYYNTAEYQQEDSMPNRCGIMFVRPSLPSNAANESLKTTQDEIDSYVKQLEQKLRPYLDYKEKIDHEMAKKLGIKDRRDEIEKFVKVNTQELAPDRWLCPLSGKRFKGPEFIRKHLFYKHMEKIVEVKKECEYFNNYIYDSKRPQLPEHPSNRPSGSSAVNSTASNPASNNAPLLPNQPNIPPQQSYHPHHPHHHHHHHHAPMNQFSGPGFVPSYGRPMWQGGGSGGGYMGAQPDYNSGYGGYGQQYQMGGGYGPQGGGGGYKRPYNPNFGGGGGGRGRGRDLIQYKDLDAPDGN
jgi:hypothetical protein